MKKLISMVCALLFVTGVTHADSTLVYTDSDNDEQTQLQMTDGLLRMDTSKGEWMLYDAEKDTLFHVDDSKRRYMTMDRASMQAMAGEMSAAMAQAAEQMKNMSPQQREMMKKMMGDKFAMPGEADTSPAAAIKDTGENDKVAGFSCRYKEYIFAGSQTRMCITPHEKLGVSDAEMKTAHKMFSLFSELANGNPFLKKSALPDWRQLEGLPVRSEQFNGKSSQVLASVNHDSIDKDRLRVPDGYKRETPR